MNRTSTPAELSAGQQRVPRPTARRVLRVAELLDADVDIVARRTSKLPARYAAALAEVAGGTLVTIELYRSWWDRLPRRWVLAGLQRQLARVQAETERTTVVAAALIEAGTVLVAQRAHPPELAGQWEFPGGKLERGESPERALVRECAEELGIQILVRAEIARQSLDSGRPGSRLILFEAVLAEGSARPAPLEHRQLRWVRPVELAGLNLVVTNRRFATDVTARL